LVTAAPSLIRNTINCMHQTGPWKEEYSSMLPPFPKYQVS